MIPVRAYIAAGAVAALVLGGWWFYRAAYDAGIKDRDRQFQEADQEGADDVRETTEKVLRGITTADPDELLRATDGLRDDDGDDASPQ